MTSTIKEQNPNNRKLKRPVDESARRHSRQGIRLPNGGITRIGTEDKSDAGDTADRRHVSAFVAASAAHVAK